MASVEILNDMCMRLRCAEKTYSQSFQFDHSDKNGFKYLNKVPDTSYNVTRYIVRAVFRVGFEPDFNFSSTL